ncbi:MAG: membrane protein insertase YidC [Lewinellaceae bacterium]|nr:membrane protein insertase YidC [Saprospiraceae bacterium]MCB9342171.1 membrane protein insertase YidC [Lewinellaceae bacterium]
MEEKRNNYNTTIGLGIIFLLLYLWMQTTTPAKTEEQQAQPTQTEQTDTAVQNNDQSNPQPAVAQNPVTPANNSPEAQNAVAVAQYGVFAAASTGSEQLEVLENDLVRITFSSKGGVIKEVFLKNYDKINTDESGADKKSPVRLLEDSKNKFEYDLPVSGVVNGKVNSGDLYYQASKNGNTITFRAPAGEGQYFEQSYTLTPDNYTLDYQVKANGLQNVFYKNELRLNWVNYLDKLERNQQYERNMSSVYYKVDTKSTSYCNCRQDDVKSLGGEPLKWFAHSNQFFNTAIVANNFSFLDFVGETKVFDYSNEDLKLLKSSALVTLNNGSANMTIYSGPNEFERLKAQGNSLQDIIPFGASIFGAINRWVIHPILDILSLAFSNKGLVILMLTLLVKFLVYPLTYRMVLSQSKMSALKPRIDELKKKHGDDQQAMSMETMKMYSEFKVNPLGGCLPIFLQMPIWFALYRFFPAAIEFRQHSFLWASDLSSYDSIMQLPFDLPFGAGSHLSLFTIIWVVTTLWYTWYSMKQMDATAMQSNDQMKIMRYMQYTMPVFFMFFFNSFASGLTLYLCFSNILNILQTLVTKNYLIDKDKIMAELEANRAKPKKKGGWRQRFEETMKEQQRIQAERQKQQQQSGKKKK